MSFNFPDSPSVNDTYTAAGRTWVWNGSVWLDTDVPLTVANLTDTNITSPTDDQILKYATDEWVNADISSVLTDYDTSTEVDNKIANIVDSAPETLNTLNELAAALGDDPNFATSVTNQISGKANTVHTHAISDVTNLQTTLNGKVDETNGAVTTADTGSNVVRNITLSTSQPTGGNDGDIWLVYTP